LGYDNNFEGKKKQIRGNTVAIHGVLWGKLLSRKKKKNSYFKELIGLFSSKYFLKISAESPLYFQYQVIDSKSKHVNNNHKLIPI